jgi:hypothetical protein
VREERMASLSLGRTQWERLATVPGCSLRLGNKILRMCWFSLQVGVLSSAVAAWALGQASQAPERSTQPFSFFHPVVELDSDEIERIRSGRVVTHAIRSSGHDVAVLAAGSLKTTPDAFISRVTDIVQLRKSRVVPAIARFSNPPTIDDLAELTLSEEDVKNLSKCRPGNCALKLADAEIKRMEAALASGGVDQFSIARRTFREILLERVHKYLDGGLDALPPYHDKSRPMDVAEAFGRLVEQSVYLDRVPQLKASLSGPAADGVTASFVYWSIEEFGRKQVIRVTHVVIVRPAVAGVPDVLVGSTQVYASHYVDAALAVTTLEAGPADTAFLGYLYRARVDVLGNFLARRIAKQRIEGGVERLFVHQLQRLQGR